MHCQTTLINIMMLTAIIITMAYGQDCYCNSDDSGLAAIFGSAPGVNPYVDGNYDNYVGTCAVGGSGDSGDPGAFYNYLYLF